jgi:hypothetical protein
MQRALDGPCVGLIEQHRSNEATSDLMKLLAALSRAARQAMA